MKFLRTIWWSPFLTHGLAFFAGVVFLPLIFIELLNSRSLMLLSLVATAALAPLLLARIHGVCYWKPLLLQAGLGFLIFCTWPASPDGNPKLAYFDHVAAWTLIFFLLLSTVQAASLLKRTRLSL